MGAWEEERIGIESAQEAKRILLGIGCGGWLPMMASEEGERCEE